MPADGVTSTEGRLDKVLADASGLSRARIQALVTEGRVTIAGTPARQSSQKLPAGTPFAIALPDVAPLEAIAQNIPLVIVHEDEHLIVVDKPAGLVVHPAAGNLDGTLVNALLHHCAGQLSGIGGVARPGIVHRIDKDTSGLLVVAKSDAAHEGLARQFADHAIERAYRAITAGVPVPEQATLRGIIARSAHDRKKMALLTERDLADQAMADADRRIAPADADDEAVNAILYNAGGPRRRARPKLPYERVKDPGKPARTPPGTPAAARGKHAVTHYRLLESFGQPGDPASAALVECRLETGRTHQVRVHMASIGHPLLGDPVYGRDPRALKPLLTSLGFARQALHACVLGFIHPVSGKTLRFASEMPADMRDLIAHLGVSDESGG